MPNLAEFLGTVLSDVARARVAADVETVKIAQGYAGHTLLRHMPIPRFRLPELTVEAPVIVEGVGDAAGSPGTPGPPWEAPTSAELSRVARRALAEAGIRATAPERRRLYGAVQRRARSVLKGGPHVLFDTRKVVRGLAEAGGAAAGPALERLAADEPTRVRFVAGLRAGYEALLTEKLLAAPGLSVAVASTSVKEHGDGQSLVRLRLTVAEDAYELVTEEREGQVETRLVPE